MTPRPNPRIITDPRPGFFVMKLVRGGPNVPAILYYDCPIEQCLFSPWQHIERPRSLNGEIDGEPCSPDKIWIFGREIDYREYMFLRTRSGWARQHAPDHPAANPKARIDLGKMRPVY